MTPEPSPATNARDPEPPHPAEPTAPTPAETGTNAAPADPWKDAAVRAAAGLLVGRLLGASGPASAFLGLLGGATAVARQNRPVKAAPTPDPKAAAAPPPPPVGVSPAGAVAFVPSVAAFSATDEKPVASTAAPTAFSAATMPSPTDLAPLTGSTAQIAPLEAAGEPSAAVAPALVPQGTAEPSSAEQPVSETVVQEPAATPEKSPESETADAFGGGPEPEPPRRQLGEAPAMTTPPADIAPH